MSMCEWERDELLDELRRRRWTFHYFGRRNDDLDAIAAVRRRGDWVTVIVLRAEDRAFAYLTFAPPEVDPLAADHIAWHYIGSAVWTLRAALCLSADLQPSTVYSRPPDLTLTELDRRPLSIRPPLVEPSSAGEELKRTEAGSTTVRPRSWGEGRRVMGGAEGQEQPERNS
ncbi:hypothetical protein EV193_11792 [Herbihabitans rhizosphaerae]|uniref:Uncharacterized protein n=1 Tax=Herbihabitans rhizosphaerae TaxID=1872711 RepID=A0A4Q7KC56_9PSEU|nr:hypothetical protein [Herbihabitans rhizosphaerae]RZS30394.1 hypothetical protein EV193_11792 [Herbihabitans rhizosphaerae]